LPRAPRCCASARNKAAARLHRHWRTCRLLFASVLALALSGCALATPRVWSWAGNEVQPVGVHHARADEQNDELYLDVRHVSGASPGTYSVPIASDWQSRPRTENGDSLRDIESPIRIARALNYSAHVDGHLLVSASDVRAAPRPTTSGLVPNRFYRIQTREDRARRLTMTSYGFDTLSNRWVALRPDTLGRTTGVALLRKGAALLATPATLVFDTFDVIAIFVLWGIGGD
jgi:hypothetical protein